MVGWLGGVPRTEGAMQGGLAIGAAGYVRTGAAISSPAGALDGWQLSRQPLPLETNLPGLFAAGDVRSGSIKRCAAAIGEGSMAVALVHQRLAESGGELHGYPTHDRPVRRRGRGGSKRGCTGRRLSHRRQA